MENSILSQTQIYAACGLFTVALHQSQIHQSHLSSSLPSSVQKEPIGEGVSVGSVASVSDRPHLWIHDCSDLLLPIFKFLKVDYQASKGLKETAGLSTQVRHHVEALLNLLKEDSKEKLEKELSLAKAVNATALSLKTAQASSAQPSAYSESNPKAMTTENSSLEKEVVIESQIQNIEKYIADGASIRHEIKITVLYELLSACLLSGREGDKGPAKRQNGYDSRHRVALRLLATWLGVEWIKMEALELIVASSFMQSVSKGTSTKEGSDNPEALWDKWKHRGTIGGAALAGGTVMAITGGLVAPALAQGLGTMAPTLGGLVPSIGVGGFAAAAGAVGSVGGSVAVAASFGAAGAGLTGIRFANRAGGLEEFEFKAVGGNHNQGRLGVGIFVSGVVFTVEDFVSPWEPLFENLERYAIHWESKNLIGFSTAIENWLTSKITAELIEMGAMTTVLSALLMASALPAALLSSTEVLDGKFAVALDRSEKAGKLLAEILLQGQHGNRPVTLIGFSVGARAIFKCLQCLAGGDNEGIVERVVLIGAPISLKDQDWVAARRMVAGRFVNAYSTSDWFLGIAFRAHLLSQGLAGIQPVDVAPGIENVDVTELVDSHASYPCALKTILERLELDAYNPVWRCGDLKPSREKTNSTKNDELVYPL